MNWLAHLHLSPRDSDTRIGSLLPDLLSRAELCGMDSSYGLGIELHYRVDAFTDAHPVFIRSKRRVGDEFRRYAGIVVDVLYDHFLSLDWISHSDIPRDEFIRDIYLEFDSHFLRLPASAAERLLAMREQDWLGSYVGIDGVSEALRRISGRLRRHVPLESAIEFPPDVLAALFDDFREFYPELRQHIRRSL